MALDNGPFKFHAGQYSTDLIANRSVEFLGDAITAGKPFFLGITPIGPHAETVLGKTGAVFKAPVPADRHKDLFPDVKVPRTPSFNPDAVSDLERRQARETSGWVLITHLALAWVCQLLCDSAKA